MPSQLPEQLLQYTDEQLAEEFVAGVMQRVKREQRIRKAILLVSGIVGALFGLAGAVALSDSITQLFTLSMSATSALPVSLAIIGVLLFLGWLLNDEMTLPD